MTRRALFIALLATAAFQPAAVRAQMPGAPANTIYMATNFCPAGYKNIHPRNTLLKIYGGYFDAVSPAVADADKEGRYLPPCERQTGGAAKPGDRFISQIVAGASDAPCPSDSEPADGKIVQINDNAALFSLLGTEYGGDGRRTFALPDLKTNRASKLRFCIVTTGVFPSRD